MTDDEAPPQGQHGPRPGHQVPPRMWPLGGGVHRARPVAHADAPGQRAPGRPLVSCSPAGASAAAVQAGGGQQPSSSSVARCLWLLGCSGGEDERAGASGGSSGGASGSSSSTAASSMSGAGRTRSERREGGGGGAAVTANAAGRARWWSATRRPLSFASPAWIRAGAPRPMRWWGRQSTMTRGRTGSTRPAPGLWRCIVYCSPPFGTAEDRRTQGNA